MTSPSQIDLAFLSIAQASNLLRRKKISPVELVDASLAQMDLWNPAVNAFITVLAEQARKKARLAEREISRGLSRGPLHGIPITLKDNFWTRGIRTTAGSRVLAESVPDQDSSVAASLAQAGAILLGKTNMHEFAYGVTNVNQHYGPVRNPWSRDRISGGSSGGSAAALAAGIGLASVGTDTGGSIRIPSALCGVVGLKPTYGLVDVSGVVPLSETLDHVGPLARSVSDVCIVLQAIAGKYPQGSQPPDYRKLGKMCPRRFRLGWPAQYFFQRVDDDVRRAIDLAVKCLQSLGGRIQEVTLSSLTDSEQAGTNISMAEATRYHKSMGYFPARGEEYAKDICQRLETGGRVTAVDYLDGLVVRQRLINDFDAAFEHVDVILAPASSIPAPLLDENEVMVSGEKEPIRSALVRSNRPANLTGHPAISIPCGFTSKGMPVGLQLIGPRWGEAGLLSIALAYEEATDWHSRHPTLQ